MKPCIPRAHPGSMRPSEKARDVKGPVAAMRQAEDWLAELAADDDLTDERALELDRGLAVLEERYPEVTAYPGSAENFAQSRGHGRGSLGGREERRRRPSPKAPGPLTCPRCDAWPFHTEDGCGYCGLGRAYPVPRPLDPVCNIARGWASAWPNTKPPTDEQIREFVKQHGQRCARCHRYRLPWRRALTWARDQIRAMTLA